MGGIPCGMERVRHDKEWLEMERARLEGGHPPPARTSPATPALSAQVEHGAFAEA